MRVTEGHLAEVVYKLEYACGIGAAVEMSSSPQSDSSKPDHAAGGWASNESATYRPLMKELRLGACNVRASHVTRVQGGGAKGFWKTSLVRWKRADKQRRRRDSSHADRPLYVGTVKQQTSGGELVNMRRLREWRRIGAQLWPQIIDNHEQHAVRIWRWRERRRHWRCCYWQRALHITRDAGR